MDGPFEPTSKFVRWLDEQGDNSVQRACAGKNNAQRRKDKMAREIAQQVSSKPKSGRKRIVLDASIFPRTIHLIEDDDKHTDRRRMAAMAKNMTE